MDPVQLPQRSWPRRTASPISFDEALSLVAAHSAAVLSGPTPEIEECELSKALGGVLASNIVADRDQPPFNRATRDGFAVRAQDVAGGTAIRVVGQIHAGEPWPPERASLLPGEAIEIMTGASLPPGADAVLMVENAQEISAAQSEGRAAKNGDSHSILPAFGRTLTVGENVVSRGSEARQGEILLEAGARLGPEEIALVASCGLRSIRLYQAPKVAILATGDELVEPSTLSSRPEAGIASHQIYDSNSHSLAALVRQAHGVPVRQRAARDEPGDLTTCVRNGLEAAPLLLLTGGVSMGRYDLVEEVLANLGAEFFFTGVKMQPGKPVVFGRVPGGGGIPARYFFGLPGNPVSTMVTFRVFVEPLLAALAGERHWQPRIALVTLATEYRCKPGLTRFLPAHLDTARRNPTVVLVRNHGSGDLAANARANCYVIVPEDCEVLAAQQTVRVLLR